MSAYKFIFKTNQTSCSISGRSTCCTRSRDDRTHSPAVEPASLEFLNQKQASAQGARNCEIQVNLLILTEITGLGLANVEFLLQFGNLSALVLGAGLALGFLQAKSKIA
jgi:hypothetical protein